MSLIEQINADFLESYKAKDTEKVGILRLLKSSLKNAEIAKKTPLDEKETIAILKREAKTREESEKEYRKADRIDLADKEAFEIGIIKTYLPEQLSESEIEIVVLQTIDNLGAKDKSAMGRVIGTVMSEIGDKVDGSVVSRIVSQKLSQ